MTRPALVGLLFAVMSAPPLVAQTTDTAPTTPVRSAGSAADSILEARTTALSKGLRCVVCQGLSIQDSPSELAQQMRAIVKEHLRAGESDEEVRAYFISKYGEWILLEPKARGFNVLVYVLPVVALIAGAGLIVRSVRRWTAPPTDTGPTAASAAAPSADTE